MQPGCRRLFTRREFEIVRRENSRCRGRRLTSFSCNNPLPHSINETAYLNLYTAVTAIEEFFKCEMWYLSKIYIVPRGLKISTTNNNFTNLIAIESLRITLLSFRKKKEKRIITVSFIENSCIFRSSSINWYRIFSLSVRAIFTECLFRTWIKINRRPTTIWTLVAIVVVFARGNADRKSVAIAEARD